MARITIDGDEKELADASASWIRDRVRAARSRGIPVCVQVSIRSGEVKVLLSTPACGTSNPARREPTAAERRILDLWRKRGMDSDDFDVGRLIAFVNEIKHV